MRERLLLTADRNNVEDVIDLAVEFDLGIEVMAFAYPDVLDGNWQHEVATYRSILRRINGPITLHGPFMDMVLGSPDNQVNQLVMGRYRHAIYIAAELQASIVVLHANFIGSLHNAPYRDGWHKRNVPFWYEIAEFAQQNGVVVCIENMWEFEPNIIGDILSEVNHPFLKACLDVGHSQVYGDRSHTLRDWFNTLDPWLIHTHMNNNNGILDEHYGFEWAHGVLDYHQVLAQMKEVTSWPNVVLEMWNVEDMRDSLYYFGIDATRQPDKQKTSNP